MDKNRQTETYTLIETLIKNGNDNIKPAPMHYPPLSVLHVYFTKIRDKTSLTAQW